MTNKPQPIGIDDFKMMRTYLTDEGLSLPYCDKTLLIKDVLSDGAQVLLFTRPRRFGKTLNMSMLQYFFGTKEPLFDGLKIAEYKNIMENYRDFPVVFLTFKDIKQENAKDCIQKLRDTIYELYQSHKYLLDSPKVNQDLIRIYFSEDFTNLQLEQSLKRLTQAIEAYHEQKVIFLLDEYDTPLHEAYDKDYFPEVIGTFRNMLGAVLKGNNALFKSVVTGITRVAKENIFSDLNNVRIYDIAQNDYAQYFGFTEAEIQAMVEPEDLADVKSWYNGYTFGDSMTIYNPWSILHFLASHKFESYWINSSGNTLIKKTLTADKMEAMQVLIEGGAIEQYYDPHIVLRDLDKNNNAFWNLLYAAGYLTSAGEGSRREKKMKIPNQEIREFFEMIVESWFGNGEGITFLRAFLEDLVKGNIGNLEHKLQDLILKTMSFRDVTETTQESFYHGLLLGITLGLRGRYKVKSNRESGLGLYDLALFPINPKIDPGVLIEVKMGSDVEAGLKQIQDKQYHHELHDHGCTKMQVYGFTFDGKEVKVVKETV